MPILEHRAELLFGVKSLQWAEYDSIAFQPNQLCKLNGIARYQQTRVRCHLQPQHDTNHHSLSGLTQSKPKVFATPVSNIDLFSKFFHLYSPQWIRNCNHESNITCYTTCDIWLASEQANYRATFSILRPTCISMNHKRTQLVRQIKHIMSSLVTSNVEKNWCLMARLITNTLCFIKKPDPETFSYNFKKMALISKKTLVQAIYMYN